MIRLDDILEDVKTVAIGGHVRPDGDCVGSVLSMLNYIEDNFPDIEAKAYLEPIPHIFEFLKRSEELLEPSESDEAVDLFICLDCSDTKRLGPSGTRFTAAKKTLCIDHHLSNDAFADENYIIPDYSSTCELVYNLISAGSPERITKEIAECLYTGIIHDTGVFRFDCTKLSTMEAAGHLMEKGIDFGRIIDETFYQKTFDQNRVTGRALQKAKLYSDGRIIASFITAEEMQEFNVKPKHLDGIVSALRDTKGALAAIFLYELEPGHFKVSTRATADINLADLAKSHGGGGHAKAAGFEIDGDAEAGIEAIVKEIEPLFDALN